jgi:hypothetical protein
MASQHPAMMHSIAKSDVDAACDIADFSGRITPGRFLMLGRNILKVLCGTHHAICLGLLTYTFSPAIGIAFACYGVAIGMILISLRLTRERNLRYSFPE